MLIVVATAETFYAVVRVMMLTFKNKEEKCSSCVGAYLQGADRCPTCEGTFDDLRKRDLIKQKISFPSLDSLLVDDDGPSIYAWNDPFVLCTVAMVVSVVLFLFRCF